MNLPVTDKGLTYLPADPTPTCARSVLTGCVEFQPLVLMTQRQLGCVPDRSLTGCSTACCCFLYTLWSPDPSVHTCYGNPPYHPDQIAHCDPVFERGVAEIYFVSSVVYHDSDLPYPDHHSVEKDLRTSPYLDRRKRPEIGPCYSEASLHSEP